MAKGNSFKDVLSELNLYMSGKKGLLDKPIEELIKNIPRNETSAKVMKFLVGDGKKEDSGIMEAGMGGLGKKLLPELAKRLAQGQAAKGANVSKVLAKRKATLPAPKAPPVDQKLMKQMQATLDQVKKTEAFKSVPKQLTGDTSRGFTTGRGVRSSTEALVRSGNRLPSQSGIPDKPPIGTATLGKPVVKPPVGRLKRYAKIGAGVGLAGLGRNALTQPDGEDPSTQGAPVSTSPQVPLGTVGNNAGATATTPAGNSSGMEMGQDNKGGVVNWMKRLAPLIAGIGGTGIAAAIGGEDAALGFAGQYTSDMQAEQERKRQQAELERKEKRLDLKEAEARMDDLLIAGHISGAQAVYEGISDQLDEDQRKFWGQQFTETQNRINEGDTDAAFLKRMEAQKIGAVFMERGMYDQALEALNRYSSPENHITRAELEEMRRRSIFEKAYESQIEINVDPEKAAKHANDFADKLFKGFVTYEQARLNAAVKSRVTEAINSGDMDALSAISRDSRTPTNLREEADQALERLREEREERAQQARQQNILRGYDQFVGDGFQL